MENYQWQGFDRQGRLVKGTLLAESLTAAKTELRKQAIIVRKIKKPFLLFRQITNKDITLFSRQLATLIKAGIPLVQALTIITKIQHKPSMQLLISTITNQLNRGLSFSEALYQHPNVFDSLFFSMIVAGEKSGSLVTMLERLASYREATERIKNKLKKTLSYPLCIVGIAFFVTLSLLIFVIPQFAVLFKNFGAELPWATRRVMQISHFLSHYWLLIAGLFFSLSYGFYHAKHHWPRFIYFHDTLLLKLPFIGGVLIKIAITKFARTLATVFIAGLALTEALEIAASVSSNKVFAKSAKQIKEEITSGQTLEFAMRKIHLFPEMVLQMIRIGEESGSLEAMLIKMADLYDEEVGLAIEIMNNLLEPFIMSILGVITGGLVITMYLPIFKLGAIT